MFPRKITIFVPLNIMELFLITFVLLSLAFAGISIKIWAKKDGEFAGTCASNNPLLNQEGESCSVCGARPDEMCKDEN